MNRGSLIVNRTSSQDIKMRELYLKIDDLPEETLHFGQSVEVPLEAGSHRIKITNRLFSESSEFTLRPDESVRFQAANVAGGALFAPLLMLGAGGYRVRLKRA